MGNEFNKTELEIKYILDEYNRTHKAYEINTGIRVNETTGGSLGWNETGLDQAIKGDPQGGGIAENGYFYRSGSYTSNNLANIDF